jgi:large subunit ribosomal protein L32e
VSIGFRSPRDVRGLTPTGFVPRIVRTPSEIEALDAQREAAVVARAVGTRRRLALEEVARRKGLRVLNPLVREEREEAEEET